LQRIARGILPQTIWSFANDLKPPKRLSQSPDGDQDTETEALTPRIGFGAGAGAQGRP
jgi:hypothetical protein